ncbi:uncharacterized protein B0H64DRAFT_472066 [Chaetomium fimeti]|uniref:Dpy-30 domain-containing protein n=1 Tax=Chaetomium fimeti TaxID=1854472 RepID=A0AAE0HLS0_9PEZI|nr:hypothetical protein B0H64DRAFT_472066 [Chaetomium fimeti]
MSEQTAPQQIPGTENPNSHPETVNGIPAQNATDISMTDAPAPAAQPPQQQTTPPAAPSPLSTTTATTTARIPTPVPTPGQPPQQQPPQAQNQHQPTSRAASQHPTDASGATPAGFAMPAEAAAHGAPVRQYLNSHVTGVLLEGMKIVARDQPKDPLRVLGEFLLQRSKELEGKDGSS